MFLVCILSSMTIDLNDLFNYANQPIPEYITKDNTSTNPITDEGATLGRVLFYDKQLSSDNSIACASCHLQEFAFGDTSLVSIGVNGVTGRHSMRLVNNRFGDEVKFFWDERAASLEAQSTMPIQDHVEMGYSGSQGDPNFDDLIDKLQQIEYYEDLFYLAYGDTAITEERMQLALSQFIRSMQSFDSAFDEGRAQVANDTMNFPNFTPAQNTGKTLFLEDPVFDNRGSRIGGGLGCGSCHRAPEFDIDPDSKSNGVIFTPGNTMPNGVVDSIVFRSPSLRDVVNADGEVNGKLMHTANFDNLTMVLNHYDRINVFPQVNGLEQTIDARLLPNGNPQDLNMTNQERNRVIAFLGTLTGSNIYTDEKWSNPFDDNGNLEILNSPLSTTTEDSNPLDLRTYPNPVSGLLTIEGELSGNSLELYDSEGQLLFSKMTNLDQRATLPMQTYPTGIYLLLLRNQEGKTLHSSKIVKI